MSKELCVPARMTCYTPQKKQERMLRYTLIMLHSVASRTHTDLLASVEMHHSMKLLWVYIKKSTRAVVQAPAPVVVGMRYSRGTSSVKAGRMNSCFTRKRAVNKKQTIKI